jgi:hypothetical protein
MGLVSELAHPHLPLHVYRVQAACGVRVADVYTALPPALCCVAAAAESVPETTEEEWQDIAARYLFKCDDEGLGKEEKQAQRRKAKNAQFAAAEAPNQRVEETARQLVSNSDVLDDNLRDALERTTLDEWYRRLMRRCNYPAYHCPPSLSHTHAYRMQS